MRAWIVAVLVVVALARWSGGAGLLAADASESARLRVVFASGLLLGLNPDDAKASIQVWGTALVRDTGLNVTVSADTIDSVDALRRRLADRSVEIYVVRTDEFIDLERTPGRTFPLGKLHVGAHDDVPTDRYVVVTHRASGIGSLAALRGRTLVTMDGSRRGLSLLWLDTELLEAGQPLAPELCAHVTQADRPARAILPVFFRQKDAALVTEASLATVAEMNPQVGRDLVVLARSDPYLPLITGVREDFASPALVARVLQSITTAAQHAAGQQILSLFGMQKIVLVSPEDLVSARLLLDKHRRLLAKSSARRTL